MLNGCYLPEQNSIEKNNNNCKSNIKKKKVNIFQTFLCFTKLCTPKLLIAAYFLILN